MNTPLIEVRGLRKRFGNLEVLKGIDLSIRHGEFLTLLGPSGCGKTTLLRAIAGFDLPDDGQVLIEGLDITNTAPAQRPINTVFQNYALFPHLNVFENIAFGLRLRGAPQEEIDEKVEQALQMVNLSGFHNLSCQQLSGGQKQRIAIARAVVNRPKVLLLDESLSALDYKLRKQMQVELKQLQRQLGITFIFVTHDQEEALSMSDRIVLLNQGNIEQIGTPQNLYEDPISLFAASFIGETTLFDATVHKTEQDQLNLSILGQSIRLHESKNFSESQCVKVMVRPEDLRVEREVDDLENHFYFEGCVRDVIYKGTVINIHITLKTGLEIVATEFYNEDSDALEYQPGLAVYVSWVPGWEVVLNAENTI